jgi:hypothetical protein
MNNLSLKFFSVFFLLMSTISFATPSSKVYNVSHDAFDALLKKHVSSTGQVNYTGFKQDYNQLDRYVKQLQGNSPTSKWSKEAQMAYWINLYNAFTIKTIVENYPVSSILKIDGGKVWDKRTIKIGKSYLTLNQIEKEKLLKQFKEPRVHFAVNCAAKSCPPLMNRAWTAQNLYASFDKQAKAFINNTRFNKLSSNSVQISKIFEWYAGDFGGKAQLVAYLKKYSKTRINSRAKVSFLEYNWDLNK